MSNAREATRPRRVGLVVGQLGLGGTEQQVVQLARGLKQAGVDVGVVAILHGGPRLAQLQELGIPVWVGGPMYRKRDVWHLPRTLFDFYLWLRRFRPDVVHAFLFEAYVLTPIVARLAGVPVVVAGRRSLSNYKEGRLLLLAVERVATRMTDAVVANADAVATDALRQEGMPPGKMHVIPNALPPAVTAQGPPELPHLSGPLLMTVANLHGYKGHEFLLDAAARLARVGHRFHLVLIGDGARRHALEARVRSESLPVAFLGARRDVPLLLRRGDIFVLPSLEEGMSNALMEAMEAGLACIATDVGGNPEVLNGAGLLVSPGDSEALADAIASLLTDEERRRQLGRAAAEHAERCFSLSSMVAAHQKLYSTLLTSAGYVTAGAGSACAA